MHTLQAVILYFFKAKELSWHPELLGANFTAVHCLKPNRRLTDVCRRRALIYHTLNLQEGGGVSLEQEDVLMLLRVAHNNLHTLGLDLWT